MTPQGLKMLLTEMESNIQEMKDIADRFESGEITDKDRFDVESRLIINTYSIRSKINIISSFIASLVDTIK